MPREYYSVTINYKLTCYSNRGIEQYTFRYINVLIHSIKQVTFFDSFISVPDAELFVFFSFPMSMAHNRLCIAELNENAL